MRKGTHERFKAHLCELVDPRIREHRGRIVNPEYSFIHAFLAAAYGLNGDP
jgi:hypothetical protein